MLKVTALKTPAAESKQWGRLLNEEVDELTAIVVCMVVLFGRKEEQNK